MIIGAVSMGRALLRLPVIAWHLGRGGVLGPIATIGLLPGWLRWLCASLDRLVRSRRAASDTGAASQIDKPLMCLRGHPVNQRRFP